MSTLALSRGTGALSGRGSPLAGEIGHRVQKQTLKVVDDLKAGVTARTSWIFNDLHSLASEQGVAVQTNDVFVLAQRFLLALPPGGVAPELAMDSDGDVLFDWAGRDGSMLSISLRGDGRLSYASRVSAYDKDHGVKQFADVVPQSILEMVQRISKR